jgi:hypothetical protein
VRPDSAGPSASERDAYTPPLPVVPERRSDLRQGPAPEGSPPEQRVVHQAAEPEIATVQPLILLAVRYATVGEHIMSEENAAVEAESRLMFSLHEQNSASSSTDFCLAF